MVVKHLFYYHLRFLSTDHKYKKNRKDFFAGRVERDVVLSGEKLYDVDLQYEGIMFGFQSGKQKFPSFSVIHNWIKQSTFWEFFLLKD
jgi:hypothetical protein